MSLLKEQQCDDCKKVKQIVVVCWLVLNNVSGLVVKKYWKYIYKKIIVLIYPDSRGNELQQFGGYCIYTNKTDFCFGARNHSVLCNVYTDKVLILYHKSIIHLNSSPNNIVHTQFESSRGPVISVSLSLFLLLLK